MSAEPYRETVPVPRATRFPVELVPPPGFVPQDPTTWPPVDGRVELVGGRLYYMPPCGGVQQVVVVDVLTTLRLWQESHRDFFVGGNEAGMLLGGDVRAADAAVFRRADLAGSIPTGYPRVPPVLAAEVGGQEEGEPELRAKAQWYLARGVGVVWLVLPATRDVVVLRQGSDSRHCEGGRLPPAPALPDLEPEVQRFFAQLAG
jgi:Uma2 family endonuclease